MHLQIRIAIHTHVHLSNCTITSSSSYAAVMTPALLRSDLIYRKLQLKCPNHKNTWNDDEPLCVFVWSIKRHFLMKNPIIPKTKTVCVCMCVRVIDMLLCEMKTTTTNWICLKTHNVVFHLHTHKILKNKQYHTCSQTAV